MKKGNKVEKKEEKKVGKKVGGKGGKGGKEITTHRIYIYIPTNGK